MKMKKIGLTGVWCMSRICLCGSGTGTWSTKSNWWLISNNLCWDVFFYTSRNMIYHFWTNYVKFSAHLRMGFDLGKIVDTSKVTLGKAWQDSLWGIQVQCWIPSHLWNTVCRAICATWLLITDLLKWNYRLCFFSLIVWQTIIYAY